MSDIPKELRYTKDHEWAKTNGDVVEIGITAYAVGQLGDVTLVDLPEPGATLTAHKRFGDIESVKTVSELFAPIGGVVVEVNQQLRDKPELVNDGPYAAGWMLRIRPANPAELSELMDAAQYTAYLGTLDH
ncbi:MAG TPA: glycine cleavage system protein GcvH [Polyangiaceae bacterium]|nr:glycine cleavage system protein GcvH [Polyangiaceae bacterium]